MPQINRGNEPVSIQRRKDLALLIYLAVTSQPHSRDTLATIFWQEESQTLARSNLRKSLSRLKALLGQNSLLVLQDQIALNPQLLDHLDVREFHSRYQQFRKHHEREGSKAELCPSCQKALEEAVALYQGDFLEGFSIPDSSVFDEWQFFQAEGYRQNLAEILQQIMNQSQESGELSQAITYCRRWLALDKLHEPAHRRLMLLYALNGQLAAAKRQYEECTRLLEEELHAKPEPETIQLFDAIQKKKLTGPQKELILPIQTETKKETPKKKASVLPSYPSPFIGREKELAEITRLLFEPSCHLLTLLGPGGSGKTRLALQSGIHLSKSTEDFFQDGVFFISLAPLTDPEAIVGALLGGLKIAGQIGGVNGHEKLLGYLQGRRILLILDNLEHLLGEESVTLISEMIAAAPQSRILVTSRERLNLQGEQIFRVEGMEIPEEPTQLSHPEIDSTPQAFSALQMFEQSATRVQPSFAITRENYESIVQICRMVQGMPLAIEMAASWLEIFTPEEIKVEINRSLDFLQSNLRDLPSRQRSLRAVFDSSWTLLDKQTRPVLKALSVFRAGFTREAAQAVAGASIKTLLDLTNKSWLQRYASGRYQIHELLRQFCFEKLQSESVTFEQVRKQYCDYYASFGSSLWMAMKGRDQKSAFSTVGEELENFNTAWIWLLEKNQLETAVDNLLPALFYYSEIKELFPEMQLFAESTSEVLKIPHDTSDGLRWKTILNIVMTIPGRFAHYEEIGFGIQKDALQHTWSMLQKQGDVVPVDYWGIRMAYAYGNFVDVKDAILYLERALSKFQEASYTWELAIAYLCLVRLQTPELSYSRKNEAVLEQYVQDALNIFTSLGDELNVSYTLIQLGNLRFKQERPEEAIEQWRLAQAALMKLDEWAIANNVIRMIGDAYLHMGQFEAAFQSFDYIARISLEHGHIQQAVGALSKESFEMVRYGDLAEARRLRQQCIEMIESTGDAYQTGWNYWEMGEILRVMHNLEEAAEWYERAHKPFEAYTTDEVWKIFYYRGFGDLALMHADFINASRNFTQSMELAQNTRHDWALVYALNGLGRSELGQKNILAARQHLLEAIQYAIKIADHGITLVAIAGYAELLYHEGSSELAVQLCSLVNSHYATWRETKDLISNLLSSLKKSMTATEFKQAQKKGKAMDLLETAGHLITMPKSQY
jgi:predicted ATPase/DNA-binding SARP family transcriptional activator/TPR repeat protein